LGGGGRGGGISGGAFERETNVTECGRNEKICKWFEMKNEKNGNEEREKKKTKVKGLKRIIRKAKPGRMCVTKKKKRTGQKERKGFVFTNLFVYHILKGRFSERRPSSGLTNSLGDQYPC